MGALRPRNGGHSYETNEISACPGPGACHGGLLPDRLLGQQRGGSRERSGGGTYIASQAGGSITWPEGLDTSATFASQLDEASGTLYVVFNSVQNRFTNYFTPAGDSITVTSYATSEKDTATTQYLVTLWEEAEGGRAYVNGHTIEFATGGDCATATFDGLTPGKNYKIGIAYMSGVYRINGGLSVSGLSSAQALEADTNTEAA